MTNHVYSICSACMQIFELAAGSECKSSAVNVPVKAYSVVVMHRLCTVYGRCIMQPILDTPCNSLVFSASYLTNHLGIAIVLFLYILFMGAPKIKFIHLSNHKEM